MFALQVEIWKFLKGCVLNLFVESWDVTCRDASVTSPIRSEPLACLLAELALLPCTKYAALPVHHFKKWLLIMSWNEAWYALHKSTYGISRFALYSIMH
jgi:hypothetical protein